MSQILVVDDDAHIRELVRVFLHSEGFEVIVKSPEPTTGFLDVILRRNYNEG